MNSWCRNRKITRHCRYKLNRNQKSSFYLLLKSGLPLKKLTLLPVLFFVCALSFGQSPLNDTLQSWLRVSMDFYDKGDHAKSAEIAWKCIEIADKEQIKGIAGKAYYCLARGAFQVQDFEKGMEYARLAFQAHRQENDYNGMGDVCSIIATLLLATNQLDSAYYYGEQSLTHYQKGGHEHGVVIAYTKLGHVFNIQGEYEKATPYYLQAYEIAKKDTLSSAYMTANICLASNYIYRKMPDAALRHNRKCYEIAKTLNMFYEQSTALYYFSGIYELKGDFKSALKYQRLYSEIRDSVMNADRIRQVKELEIKYQAAKKDDAIQLLENDKSRQRAVIWAGLATLALLLFVAVQIYRSYRRRTSDNQKLTAVNMSLESEKIKTTQQLAEEARERERLNEMDAFKSRFFTNISHEFRTPLTVILGMAEQLGKEIAQPEGTTPNRFLTLIKRNGQNLLRLINEILDLAKLENNSLNMNYVQGDVLPYLRYLAESMHSLAATKNVTLKVESSPGASGTIMMDYDPERLLQIMHNLLSNAVKFTPAGGQVILRIEQSEKAIDSESWLQISVADTGIGIAPEDLPLVFDRFFQTQNQQQAKSGGTGIGLSLTKELVRAMGGDISVESTLGAGTTFRVALPIANKADKTAEPYGQSDTPAENRSESFAPATGLVPPATGSHLLIIEDNPDVVDYLAACLGRHYHLDFAYDGQAGIEKAIATIPDLIISDVMMPEKDGFEVLETLKLEECSSHIPIILLTAKATVTDRIAGLRRGADAYLAKPFVEEELLVVVANLLESRRKLQEKFRSVDFGLQMTENDISAETVAEPEIQEPKSTFDLENVFLKKTIALIDEHIEDAEFGNAELSRKILMSESQLHRKIKALTDQSLSVFIRSVRLRRSRVLLQTTDLTVSEVAYAVGFTDPAYFSRTFSAEFGAAPTAFRKG